MTTAVHPPTTMPAGTHRKTALVAGSLYLITFISSIPAYILITPVLNDPNYIIGGGADGRVTFGSLLDVVNALACVGTAVALFPLLRRQSEGLALGFVTSRMLEAAIITTGVASLLAVVTLRQDMAGATGAEATSLVTTGQALVAVRDWTFLFGPGVMAAVNALLLGTLMYRSRLVPRIIPTIGLIGAPLLLASDLGVLFGTHDQSSGLALLAALPVAVWELSVGTWMLVKGFRPSPLTTREAVRS
jgi:Domain of unknown function (DUF4386)